MRRSSYTLGASETAGCMTNSRILNFGERKDGDLVVKGQSILEKEIYYAQAIPSECRVLVRQDSSLQELTQSNDDPLA